MRVHPMLEYIYIYFTVNRKQQLQDLSVFHNHLLQCDLSDL